MNKPVRRKASTTSRPSTKNKDTILATALRIFARDGFDGASLPKIAEAAGIAHPLILYYFGSKDKLWRAVVDHAFGSLIEEATLVESTSRNLAPLDRLRVLIRALSHFAAHYPDHFGLIMAESRSGSERLAWLRETYADAFLRKLEKVLREAQELKQIREVPVEHLSFILMGAILLFFTFNFHFPKGADLDEIADRHARYVTEIILDNLRLDERQPPSHIDSSVN